jgi:hypothetical protein
LVQSNSIFNYLNTASFVGNHAKSLNKLWFFEANNANILLVGSKTDKFDIINAHVTGFKKTNFANEHFTPSVLSYFFLFQWCHLGFRGKSYRIRNFCRVNKFTFNLGYSHWTKLKLLDNWSFYKRRRQNYTVYSFFLKDFLFFKRLIPFIRFYNCYTMRGLRLRKQPIIRRFGKISQHISSLH